MIRRVLTIAFAVLFLSTGPLLADLTGEWTDENGACYKIRQVGDRVYWQMDGSPRVINVFSGLLVGDVINGRWADLPGYQLQGSGTLSLRVESDSRMTKIGTSAGTVYRGSVLTRQPCTRGCSFDPNNPPPSFVVRVNNAPNFNTYTRIGTGNEYRGEYDNGAGVYAIRTVRVSRDSTGRLKIETTSTNDGWSCVHTGDVGNHCAGTFDCKKGSEPSIGGYTIEIGP